MRHLHRCTHSRSDSSYSLNIKGIPYETVWIEYPDVEAVCKKIGAPPTGTRSDGQPLYTLPTIFDPNTAQAVSDSPAIARYLDRTYPHAGPALVPRELDALIAAFQTAFMATTFGAGHFAPIIVPAACALLNPRSEAYYRASRTAVFGDLDALAPVGSERRAEHWRGTRRAFDAIAGWLGKEADGAERLFFTGGDNICFADVTIAGFLKYLEICLPAGEWEDLLSWDGGRWGRFMEAFKRYEAVDEGSYM